MKKYREKKKDQGMVQVRVWVPQEHEEFIKKIAKECRPERPAPKLPQRYGRRASDVQIRLAKSLATIHQKEPPEHLYDYHISLSGWMWAHGGKSIDYD